MHTGRIENATINSIDKGVHLKEKNRWETIMS
jgi:hypothetical protein